MDCIRDWDQLFIITRSRINSIAGKDKGEIKAQKYFNK